MAHHFRSPASTSAPGYCTAQGCMAHEDADSALQPCPWTADDATQIPARDFLPWAGLDFDTAEMDVDLREALAAMAPHHGLLRALPPTARCSDAARAFEADTARNDNMAARLAMSEAMSNLARVQDLLLAINRNLTTARAALGLVK